MTAPHLIVAVEPGFDGAIAFLRGPSDLEVYDAGSGDKAEQQRQAKMRIGIVISAWLWNMIPAP
jgi:hypothetical protein